MEQTEGSIGFQVNAKKTEYMRFNREGAISILNGGHLKLLDKFSYLGSSISSTEMDVNMRRAKAWADIDRLLLWGHILPYLKDGLVQPKHIPRA